jgi:hypothetical protein
MRKLLISLSVAVLAVLAVPINAFASTSPAVRSATTNLIKNGSFEKPVVPNGSYAGFSTGQSFGHWTVTGANGNIAVVSGTFTESGFSFPAESGNQWVDLTGVSNTATGLSQSVTTVSGASYLLIFWVGNVYDPGGIFGTTSTVDVIVDGMQVRAAVNSEMGTTQVWKKFKVQFTASSTSTSITFLNGDPSNDTSNGLDGITLSKQG